MIVFIVGQQKYRCGPDVFANRLVRTPDLSDSKQVLLSGQFPSFHKLELTSPNVTFSIERNKQFPKSMLSLPTVIMHQLYYSICKSQPLENRRTRQRTPSTTYRGRDLSIYIFKEGLNYKCRQCFLLSNYRLSLHLLVGIPTGRYLLFVPRPFNLVHFAAVPNYTRVSNY